MKDSRAVLSVGNTNTKFSAVTQRNTLARVFSAPTNAHVQKKIISFCEKYLEEEAKIISASVVPSVAKKISAAFAKKKDTVTEISSRTKNLPIKILYKTPRTLGADRIAVAIGAYKKNTSAFIIVDCGTATTFTVVSNDGELLGGAITLGLDETMKALARRAAQLYQAPLKIPKNIIGRSTKESLQSGVARGHVAMIEGIIEAMKKELGGTTKIFLTGGAAKIISKHLSLRHRLEKDLALKGLAQLLQ